MAVAATLQKKIDGIKEDYKSGRVRDQEGNEMGMAMEHYHVLRMHRDNYGRDIAEKQIR